MKAPALSPEDGVIGVGIDLIETSRIRESMDRFGDRFLQRVFCPGELEYVRGHQFPEIHLAARFAAKEAASKACGTGIGEKLGWKDVEVCRNEAGAPWLQWHGHGPDLLASLGAVHSHVSLTHTRGFSAAVVVLTRRLP